MPAPYQRRHLPRNNASGFVLVATLFAVTIIAIGVGYFAERVEELRVAASHQQQVTEAERAAYSIQQTLAWAAATRARTERGLEAEDPAQTALQLDGRSHAITATLSIAIQDERGLFNLNYAEEPALRRFLAALGVPIEQQDRLVDVLGDYLDIDDLKRINGAERADYSAAGLAPPANDLLNAVDELRQILVWRDLISTVEQRGSKDAVERFLDLFSVARTSGVNVNTARREVLMSLPGLDHTRIGALIDQRLVQPFQNLAELLPFSNGALDAEQTLALPASSWRVRLVRDGLPFLIECRLGVTPSALDKPVRVGDCLRRPLAVRDSGLVNDEFASLLSAALAGRDAPAPVAKQPGQPTPLPDPNRRPSAETLNTLSWLRPPEALTRN